MRDAGITHKKQPGHLSQPLLSLTKQELPPTQDPTVFPDAPGLYDLDSKLKLQLEDEIYQEVDFITAMQRAYKNLFASILIANFCLTHRCLISLISLPCHVPNTISFFLLTEGGTLSYRDSFLFLPFPLPVHLRAFSNVIIFPANVRVYVCVCVCVSVCTQLNLPRHHI
jgi:hypothetical protein